VRVDEQKLAVLQESLLSAMRLGEEISVDGAFVDFEEQNLTLD